MENCDALSIEIYDSHIKINLEKSCSVRDVISSILSEDLTMIRDQAINIVDVESNTFVPDIKTIGSTLGQDSIKKINPMASPQR